MLNNLLKAKGVFVCVLLLSCSAPANDTDILEKLKAARADLEYKIIGPSEVPGFVELQIGNDSNFYVSSDGKFLFDGDVYLVGEGDFSNVKEFKLNDARKQAIIGLDFEDLIVFEELDIHLKYQQYWWLSILVIPVIMILSSMGVISIVKGVLLGVILLLVLKVISIQDAYEAIDWSVIFLIAALIPLGKAINITGMDLSMGESILNFTNYISRFFDSDEKYILLVSMLYLVSMLTSSFLSNAAVAIVLSPIAVLIGYKWGIDPRPLIFAVCLGSSNSFLTPIGYQTNMMVYGPGQYRFNDFMRVGLPLSILFWLTATYLITYYWPIKELVFVY